MPLALRNIKKTFVAPDGSAAPVLNVSALDVADAEQLSLIGGSGSGKTTLLHIIAGILTADTGSITFTLPGETVDIATLRESARDHFRGRRLGYVFQTHHLLPAFTAVENVLLGMSFTGRRPDRPWAEHLLERVGLKDRLSYKPGKLSIGQQQRVAVARALANRPALVLADEPTGALDPKNASQVLELMRQLCGEIKAMMVIVTHDLAIAGSFARVIKLSDINSVAEGAR